MGPNQQILVMRKKGLMFTRQNPCSECGFALIIAYVVCRAILHYAKRIKCVGGLLCVVLISAEICVASFNSSSKFCYSTCYVSLCTIVIVTKLNVNGSACMVILIFCSDMESVESADAQEVSTYKKMNFY